jgi:hypothetical protein
MNEETKNLPAQAGTFTPQKWTERFKAIAAAQAKSEQTSGQFFSIKSGVLAFNGNPIPGNKMDVVVLEALHERVYYPEKYGTGDADKVATPACYSYSLDGEKMTPHPEARDIQHPTCAGCPRDKWGSGDNGKGKACKEGRRMSLMSASDLGDADKVGKAVVAYLRLPVTSVKNWGRYVSSVIGITELPAFASITRLSVVPDAKTQVQVKFERVAGINDDAVMDAVFGRATAEATASQFPYPKISAEDEQPKASKKPSKF